MFLWFMIHRKGSSRECIDHCLLNEFSKHIYLRAKHGFGYVWIRLDTVFWIRLDTIFGYGHFFGYESWIRAGFIFGYVLIKFGYGWIRLDTVGYAP